MGFITGKLRMEPITVLVLEWRTQEILTVHLTNASSWIAVTNDLKLDLLGLETKLEDIFTRARLKWVEYVQIYKRISSWPSEHVLRMPFFPYRSILIPNSRL